MRRNQYVVIALLAGVAVPLTHCATTDPLSSESHFLGDCAKGCGPQLDCICGVCSVPCAADTACARHPGAACLADPSFCGGKKLCDVACSGDAGCASSGASLRCIASRCRDHESSDASVADRSSEDGAVSLGARHPRFDAGPPLTLLDSGLNSRGACQFPVPSQVPPNNACANLGPEGCALIAGSAYGRPCCFGRSCALDFGSGCTLFPYTPPGTPAAITVSACNRAQGPGLLFGDRIDDVAIGEDGAYVLENDGNGAAGNSQVIRVRNSDCSRQTLYQGVAAWSIEVVGQTVYLLSQGAAASPTLLAFPTTGGTPKPIELGALLHSDEVYFAMGRGPTSLFLQTRAKVGADGSLADQHGFVEVPCCGAPPRVLALSSDVNFPEGDHVLYAGTFLFAAGQGILLSAGYTTKVASLELASNRMTDLLDGGEPILPVDAHDGKLYVVPNDAIVTIDPLTCKQEQLVFRPGADITALSVDADGAVFWAESYSELTVSRVFVMQADGTGFTQILEVPGGVTEMWTDPAYVYFLSYSPQQLFRAPKPH